MNTDTISTLAKMTAPYGDRVLKEMPLEIDLWHIDRSTFAAPRKVKIVQAWTLDFLSSYYKCETDKREYIESTDLLDHEPVLATAEDGARYWL